MLVVVSNWHLYYSQHPVCLIYYIGYMSNPQSLAFSMIISRLIIETQSIEMCLSCHGVTRMASHLSGLNRTCHFSAQLLNLLRSSCKLRTSSGLLISITFWCRGVRLDCGWCASWNILYVNEKVNRTKNCSWRNPLYNWWAVSASAS